VTPAVRNGFQQSDIDLAKNVDLVQLAGGRMRLCREGRVFWGCCPFHNERTPSFKIEGNRFYCFGCHEHGDAIAFLQRLEGIGFREAVRRLRANPTGPVSRAAMNASGRASRPSADESTRTANALRIWRETTELPGTPGWHYLERRGIDTNALPGPMDGVLRWHPACPWESGKHGCIVALYTDALTGEPRAIHRTAVTLSGEKVGRKALGPKKNCVIRLWPDDCVTLSLVVGEGIETVLAAATRMGTAFRPAWATGDADSLGTLQVLAGLEALTILVDHDQSGTGQREARNCYQRWHAAGRDVIALMPRTPGFDFNNVAARRAA